MATAGDPWAIRPARLSDAEALAGVDRRSWTLTYPGIVPGPVLQQWIEESPGKWRALLSELPPDAPQRLWVGERDGAVLGYATTSPAKSWWLEPPAGAGELTNLYLDPDAIGKGLGRALFERAMGDLATRGFDPLLVWAFRDNQLARRFYDGMGLTVDVPDHTWLLADTPCPIVRYRLDRAAASLLPRGGHG